MNSDKDDFKENLSSIMFDERLANEPFIDEPEDIHLTHTQPLIDKLQHLSRFGNLLTIVMGERGCGKTYLAQQLIDTISEESDICHIKAQPMLTVSQLFQKVQLDLLAETGTAIDNESFQDLLDEIEPPHVNRVLIIDDADTLSSEVLRDICQLSSDEQDKDSPFLKIILFANHDLNISIESAASGVLPETGIYTLDIPGLTDEDAYSWVNHVLRQHGYDAEQDEIETLLEDGGDNFNELERLAIDYAQEAEDEIFETHEPEAPAVSMMGYWFAGLTIVILAVLGGFFYQDELSELLFPEPTTPEPMIVEEALNVSQPVAVETQTTEQAIESTQEEASVESTIDEIQSVQDSMATITETNDDLPAEKVDSALDTTEQTETLTDLVNEETAIDDLSDQPKDVVPEALPVAQEEPAVVQEPVIDNTPIIDTPQYSMMEERLLSLNDDAYVVQIIGLTNDTAIEKLVSDHADLGLIYYRSLLNGKPWKIIVIPGFDSYADANQQRQALPEQLAMNKPWIKSIKKVKEEIRAAVQ